MTKFVCLLLAVLTVTAAAQTAIDGIVRDQDEKAVANATVTLQRAEGSIAQKTNSDSDGHFRFAAVDAGAYTLSTDAQGFFPAKYDFVLRARQPLSLSLDLQRKATVEQKVEVNANYLT